MSLRHFGFCNALLDLTPKAQATTTKKQMNYTSSKLKSRQAMEIKEGKEGERRKGRK